MLQDEQAELASSPREFMSKGGFQCQDIDSIAVEFHYMLFNSPDPEAEAEAAVDVDAEGKSIYELCMYLDDPEDDCYQDDSDFV
jgi:hypothetical protein